MTSRPIRLTLAQWALLALVTEEPRHPFALAKLLAPRGELGQVWAVPISAVYRSLAALESAGLVAAVATLPSQNGPNRTLYAASPAGRTKLAGWLGEPVEHVREARSGLLLKLLILERRGEASGELLEAQAARFAGVVAASRTRAATSGESPVLALWRLEAAGSVMRFIESARSEMADPAAGQGAGSRHR